MERDHVPVTDLTILSTGHHVADARLHQLAGAAVEAGVTVTVRAHGPAGDAPPGVTYLGRTQRPRRSRRFVSALVVPAQPRDPVLMILDPDLIIPSWFWARLRRRKLIVDIHEDYDAVSRDRPWVRGTLGPLVRLTVRLSMWFAARADLTVVADDHLPPRAAYRRLVARPSPERFATPDLEARHRSRPRAVYVGDVRPSRGLWSMLEAIASAPCWSLDIVGRLSEVSHTEVTARLDDLGIADRVTLHGQQPPERSWSIAQGAWCGLALLDDTPAYRATVPNKVHEYLAAGLPVLASPLPRVAELLDETGAGAVVASPEAAGALLRRWGCDPAAIERMARAGICWTRSRPDESSGFEELASHIRRMIGNHHGPSSTHDRQQR